MPLGLGMTEPQTMHYGFWDGSSTFLCAYVLSIIIIWYRRKDYWKAFLIFVPVSAMTLAICYFPPTQSLMLQYIPVDPITKIQVIRRIRWIFLVLPTLAFGLTNMIQSVTKFQQVMITGIVIATMFLSVYGSDWSASGLKTGYWNRRDDMDHLYKISNVSLAMGDTIMNENVEELLKNRHSYITILVGDDGSNGYNDDGRNGEYFARCLRQYLSPICYKTIDLTDSNYPVSIKGKEEYVLCPDDPGYIKDFTEAGYNIEWNLDGYCFMKRKKTS